MEVIRHGKPHGSYLATLHRATKTDYDRLVQACMEAIITGEVDIIVAFPYVLKFPKGFPKGILERKVGANNIHRIKARKLLTWLNEHGYTLITVESLKRQRAEFTRMENSFGNFDLGVDVEQEVVHNVDTQLDKEED